MAESSVSGENKAFVAENDETMGITEVFNQDNVVDLNAKLEVAPSSPIETTNESMNHDKFLDDFYPSPCDGMISPLGPQPFSSFSPSKDQKADAETIQGACGLKNLGNTCFMNSGLQCLLNNINLICYFFRNKCQIAEKDGLVSAFASLMTKVWSGEYSAISPSELKELLGKRHAQFKDFRQHDCQEFLAILLDTFHEQLNTFDDPLELCNECEKSSELSQLSMETKTSRLNSPPKELPSTATSESNLVPIQPTQYEACCSHDLSTHTNDKNNKLALIRDLIKDTKTLNTNVLINESVNNQLAFDSTKFPKFDRIRYQEAVDNLHSYPVNFMENSIKNLKVKETNLLAEKELKNLKVENVVQNNQDFAPPAECSLNSIKRLRFDGQSIMNCKKIKTGSSNMENDLEFGGCLEDNDDLTNDSSDQSDEEACAEIAQPDRHLEDNIMAEREWKKHLVQNKSVIVDTFLGQFKSTVVCSVCNYLSVTFEPFMYLPVPLPRAMERQFKITYIPCRSSSATQYVVTVMKTLRVTDLKQAFLSLIGETNSKIVLAEVFKNHVSKILDDSLMLQLVNDDNRQIYGYKLENFSVVEDVVMNDEGEASSVDDQPMKWHSCAICLEDMLDIELLTHPSCGCILCQGCIEISRKHYGGTNLVCPVCTKEVVPEDDFIPLSNINTQVSNQTSRNVLTTPILFRCNAKTNGVSKTSPVLFGHPVVIQMPISLPAAKLYEYIEELCPIGKQFQIVTVNGQGLTCSRCIYTTHCSGCEIKSSEKFILHPGDNLCVEFDDMTTEEISKFSLVKRHSSVDTLCKNKNITIYNCLEAFSESEKLDERNPWFCPTCEKNQSAMKTLTVWKYPDTVMVYLKRFVFHNFTSTKLNNRVIFPINDDLELGEFVSGPGHYNNTDSSSTYNLQSCISHIGGMNSGHYASYCKHAATGEWYYFNDESVLKKEPQIEDQSNAYILFYQKKGIVNLDLPSPVVKKTKKFVARGGSSLMEMTSFQSMNPDAVNNVLKVLEDDEQQQKRKSLL